MKKFGTFGGVFVPNILTILGVIMYLRLGWIVGNAGFINTLLILTISILITLFTAFSMSSIATNMKMKSGGAYFMISRSLGIETGGSIGIPLYLAQALGIGLYIVGFAETIVNIFPNANPFVIGVATLSILTILALISSSLVIKIQFFILGIVALSIISFFLGKPPQIENISFTTNYSEGYSFWPVFAIFFPAVTGILSGVSMSGDLKDPAKSIPRGTILSVLVGTIIYFSIAIWFTMVATSDELVNTNEIMIHVSRWAPLIYLGIWGATLSSALANILAAPRTMQALASDGVLFKILKKGRGQNNEPLIATIITYFIVLGVIYIGELNVIATILTMFFLITYGSINIIAFIERILKRPGYRPTFKVHWIISLIGAIGSVWVMFIINVYACLGGFAIVIAIYFILMRIQLQKNWGDVRRGLWSAFIQYSLEQLNKQKRHPKSWRPNILIYSKDNISKKNLFNVAAPLTKKNGFMTFINLIDPNEKSSDDLAKEDAEFNEFLNQKQISAFHNNVFSDSMLSGQMVSAQAHGIGEFKHNTILMEWTDPTRSWMFATSSEMSKQFKLIRFYRNMNLSLMILNVKPELKNLGYKNIDVWWDPSQDNGSFMLLISYLISSGNIGLDSNINIKTIVLKEKKDETYLLLEELVQKSRIKANISVLFPEEEEIRALEAKYDIIQNVKQKKQKIVEIFNENNLAKITNLFKKADGKKVIEEIKAPSIEEENIVASNIESNRDEDELIKEKLSEKLDEKDIFLLSENVNTIIINNSRNADLVLLGFNLPEEGKEQSYIEKTNELLKELPDTLLVNCPFEVNLFG